MDMFVDYVRDFSLFYIVRENKIEFVGDIYMCGINSGDMLKINFF